MEESLLADLVVYFIIAFLIIGIIVVVITGFKHSNTATIYGATAELYNKEKKAAMETIVEQKAHKKMEEEESGEPL